MSAPHRPSPPAERAALARLRGRAALAQARTLGLLCGLLALTGLLIGAAAVAAQAGRDETRAVDLLVLATPQAPADAQIAAAVDAYQRGIAPAILLVGPGAEVARARLLDQGLPETALSAIVTEAGLVAEQWLSADQARAQGVQSLLLLGEPAELLVRIKLARDLGFQAYGAPVPGQEPDLLDLIKGSAIYWGYVLRGEPG